MRTVFILTGQEIIEMPWLRADGQGEVSVTREGDPQRLSGVEGFL